MKKTRTQLAAQIVSTLFLLFCLSTLFTFEPAAQVRPVYDQGALGLAQLLKRLNTDKRVLMIGAHPDDEDTALLAYLARGESAATAYLSLTRGDGGQNIIGPELGEALGVIRTEELIQARTLDGAGQFFTRAYDYGFSKTLAEAKSKWDEKVILCDVVNVIRFFRPQVVIAQFNGTPSDGHGQHQFAGYISPIAIKAAADPTQCKNTEPAWTVTKFYIRHRGQGEPTLRINTGKYDPLLGRSYFEIAMHARSQHRSQEQGVLELKGEQFSNLTLVNGPPASETDRGIFGGLDSPGTPPHVNSTDAVLSSDRERLIRQLVQTVKDKRDNSLSVATAALVLAAGIRFDALADRETAVPGESFPVAVRIFSDVAGIKLRNDISFNLPFEKTTEPPASNTGFFRRETANIAEHFRVSVPADAPITQPYWLVEDRIGDLFSIPNDVWRSASLPFREPEPVFANVTIEIEGQKIQVRVPVEYRYADDIRGELRRELNIVPKLAVALDSELVIVPTAAKQPGQAIAVSVTNNSSGPAAGSVRLIVPDGWKVTPSEIAFAMKRKNEKTVSKFVVNIAGKSGTFQVRAEATSGGETFFQTMQTVAYEHIQTHRIYRPAKADIKVIELAAAPVKVGYIRGSGDRVPEAIRQLGLDVENIDERMLSGGDLSGFDTIVVGIRAYQVRPDVVANNQRLLDFANKGGTLIVQYQLPPTYSQQNLTPFPAQMGPRVSDENAPVTVVQQEHPVLNFPNKITGADFTGWVQERNLYNFSTMDAKYTGLLESHDAGEPENKGGLVVADIGKGKYVYCSYSLFRQLPAGVPGAYRLLANLVSLPKAKGGVTRTSAR